MKPIYIFFLLSICTLPLQAQKTAAKDTLLSREMTLEKEYNPTIESAAKINRLPELREPQAPRSKVEFSNYSTTYEVQNGLASLMPKSMLTDLNTSKYAGYASLYLSTLADFDADAAYQILNTNRDYLDIYFSHRSSNSKNPSLQLPSESQKFFMNDNWGGFNFSHNFDKVKLLADMKYLYSAFNYSGLTITNIDRIMLSSSWPGSTPVYEMQSYPNQTDNLFEAHAGIVSETSDALNYKVNLRYTYFKQKYANQTAVPGVGENRVIIDWDLHQNYNSASGFGLSGFYKTYKYSSEAFRSYGNDDLMTYSVLSINPYYYAEGDNFDATLGLSADFELGGRKKAVVAPSIRFNYNPSETFTFYALALGGRNDNSNYDLFFENRYVFPLQRVLDSRTYLDGTAGLRYLPVSNISLDVFTGYKITKDEHFFSPSPGWNWNEGEFLGGMFLQAEHGTANVAKIGAQINYTLPNLLGVNVKGTFYNWDVTGINLDADGKETKYNMEAWHKPQFELGTDVYFRTPTIPLRVDLAFKGLFGRKMIEPYAASYFTMKDVYDLSVKTSYQITPNFSAYLSTNNLLFQKQDIWYAYPAQKTNIMAGISVMF
ncbi:hypothetical protein FACS189451_02100 [Bacteroidia bacterium]|nr:hypothetical protein FACS189451_02100 [Bacteroidia bacterium]